MPFTRITTNFDLTGQRAGLGEKVQQVLNAALGIPLKDRLLVFEQNLDSFYQPLDASGRFAVIEITLLPGRGLEQKRDLYKQFADLFSGYGVDPINTRIVLREVPAQNWGIKGGQAACDVLGIAPDQTVQTKS